jgi:hypothetical protein
MKFIISIRKDINNCFRKINCPAGIAPPTWERGWGGAYYRNENQS